MRSILPKDILGLLENADLCGQDIIRGRGATYRNGFIILPQKYFDEVAKQFPFGFVHASIFPEILLDDFPTGLDEESIRGSYKHQLTYLIASGIKLTDDLYNLDQQKPKISDADLNKLKSFLEEHFKTKGDYLLKGIMPPRESNFSVRELELEYVSDLRSQEYDQARFQEMEETTMFYLGGLDKSPLFAIYLPVSKVDSRSIKKSFILAREKIAREIRGETLSDLYETAKLPEVHFEGVILEDVGFFSYLRSTPDIISIFFYESVNNLKKSVKETNSYHFLKTIQEFYNLVVDSDRRLEYELFA